MTSEALADIAARAMHEKAVEGKEKKAPGHEKIFDFYEDVPQDHRNLLIDILKNGFDALLEAGYIIAPPVALAPVPGQEEELDDEDRAELEAMRKGKTDL